MADRSGQKSKGHDRSHTPEFSLDRKRRRREEEEDRLYDDDSSYDKNRRRHRHRDSRKNQRARESRKKRRTCRSGNRHRDNNSLDSRISETVRRRTTKQYSEDDPKQDFHGSKTSGSSAIPHHRHRRSHSYNKNTDDPKISSRKHRHYPKEEVHHHHQSSRRRRRRSTSSTSSYISSKKKKEKSRKHHARKEPKRRHGTRQNYSSSSSSDYHSHQRKRRRHNPPQDEEEEPLISSRKAVVSEDDPPSIHSSSQDGDNRDDSFGHFQGGSGTFISDRYEIVRDVGLGIFGRVVACIDHRRKEEVAIKIVRNVKRYYESAQIEADILRHVNSRRDDRATTLCVLLKDHFTTVSRHYCLVFESLGWSLYDFLKHTDFQPFPLECIQDFSQQLLSALEFLHSFQLIHTDLKPENILLLSNAVKPHGKNRSTIVPASTRIKLIDFGGSCYEDERKSSVINTRQYRAPEVILELPWSYPSDLWSLGCILAELYTGNLFFATHDNKEHFGLMEQAIGPFPKSILEKASSPIKKVFDSRSGLFSRRLLSSSSRKHVERMPPLDNKFLKDADFLHLLKELLVIDPHRRATALDALHFSFPRRSHFS
eukprot:CAMPEP_0172432640 /NCGR_PEP_ID=MMETSP1064-20121228/64332_1 /TAXON_ID=202472 /ORGANISM="Aulacoseira subarctica , Strain CCAP 1002/5" /LENGTH=596 /DNA_ID=CAMNT_0013180107 /DNA_START=151 /DNA_END=1941 /DNA_ORIENTATION=-